MFRICEWYVNLSTSAITRVASLNNVGYLGNSKLVVIIVHQVLITLFFRKLMNILGHNGIITMLVLFLLSVVVAEFFYWKPVKHFLTKTVYGD